MIVFFLCTIFSFIDWIESLPICNQTTKNLSLLCSDTFYDKSQYPEPLPNYVKLQFVIQNIIEINENEQTIKLSGGLELSWKDNRVKWDLDEENKPVNYPFYFTTQTEMERLWQPRVFFLNSIKHNRDSQETGFSETFIYVDPSTLQKIHDYTFSFKCKMDFKDYPFDLHLCQLHILSGSGRSDFVQLEKPIITFTNDFHQNLQSLQFEVAIRSLNSTNEKQFTNSSYSQANIEFKLTRNAYIGLISTFYIPTFTFSLLALVSYTIPIESVPGRMGLLITLYLIAVNIYIAIDMPKPRKDINYADIWFYATIAPIILGVVEYGAILTFSKFGDGRIFGRAVNYRFLDAIFFGISLSLTLLFSSIYLIIAFQPFHVPLIV